MSVKSSGNWLGREGSNLRMPESKSGFKSAKSRLSSHQNWLTYPNTSNGYAASGEPLLTSAHARGGA